VFTAEELELEDPYDFYARLRAADGIERIPGTRIHLVARHDDVMEVLERADVFSNTIQDVLYDVEEADAGSGAGEGAAADVLATADPPRHTVHRHLLATVFTSRRVADLEPFVRATVQRLLATSVVTGRVEWMGTVALPLPLTVVSRLLTLPSEDLSRLQRWSDAGVDVLGAVTAPERMLECSWLIADWVAYHREQARRLATEDAGADGIAPAIGRAVRDGEISLDEAASLFVQLVAAGSESTSSLIGSAARILAGDADLQRRLRDHPTEIPLFIEEVLRLEAPFRGHYRQVMADTELRGVPLSRGDRLFVLWSSANRDPDAFDEPDRLRLERAKPRQHLSFGNGLHFCIGAPLARLEARVALEELLARTRDLRLEGTPRHLPNLMVRRVAALELTFEPAPA
jgi:cytochrome P450